MDIDFYQGFDYVKSVTLGKDLWNSVLKIEYLDQIEDTEEIIPKGHDGAGESIERISIENHRNNFINGFAKVLVFYSKKKRTKSNIEEISTILELLTSLNDSSITHFKLDV